MTAHGNRIRPLSAYFVEKLGDGRVVEAAGYGVALVDVY
jgi:hypothetical protein